VVALYVGNPANQLGTGNQTIVSPRAVSARDEKRFIQPVRFNHDAMDDQPAATSENHDFPR
jgi:hypothetical protein